MTMAYQQPWTQTAERAQEYMQESMQPIDDAMIDQISQKKDTLRGTFRGSLKAGMNNDDIDDVVGITNVTHLSEVEMHQEYTDEISQVKSNQALLDNISEE